jgi:prophage tail gpP-like protein
VQVQGRDLMGLLCSHDITEYGIDTNLSGVKLETIVQTVLKDVPFVDRLKDVIFEGKLAKLAVPLETLKSEPGQTVFDLLKLVATSRGVQFWCREDGKFVFGTPITKGFPTYTFTIDKRGGTNVLSGKLIRDISQAFSKIFVYAQASTDGTTDCNIEAAATLKVPSEFPYYKPKVVTISTDKTAPRYEAHRLMNSSRSRIEQLTYSMPGHSLDGVNFRTNTIAWVHDEDNQIYGDRLIFGRTMSLESKESGPQTTVRLCQMGASFE